MGIALGLLVASPLSVAARGDGEPAANRAAGSDSSDTVKATIPLGSLNHVCPLDCIPSIDDPQFRPASKAGIASSETVIGIVHNGVAKAYPLSRFREVVNDEIGGTPVVVTWCPLCGTPIAFQRTLDGKAVQFGVSGKLHHRDLVLYDRLSYTLWQQVTGEAIIGPRVPEKLTMIPVDMVSFGQWVRNHPDSLVLTGGSYTRSSGQHLPYEDQLRGSHQRELTAPSRHIDPYTVVYGIEVDGASKAYPLDVIRAEAPIYDSVGGVELAVLAIPETGFVRMVSLAADGAPTRPSIRNDEIVDASGHRWDLHGHALSEETEDLSLLTSVRSYWFGWASFHPETEVYGTS
jgi:hypothetical protein